MTKIIILYENEDWISATTDALDNAGLIYETWNLTTGFVDTSKTPENAIYFSKMSASAYTRGNANAATNAAAILSWLESHDCVVINGSGALKAEISKWHQMNLLNKAGIKTPRTIAAFTKSDILNACDNIAPPYMLKPNCGGKGLGVQRFESKNDVATYLDSTNYQEPIDGIWLLQETIIAKEKFITRMEFIGGEFYYAVRVDTSGGFELCPAEVCNIPTEKDMCMLDAPADMFTILKDFYDPLIQQCKDLLNENGIKVAGVEFIEDAKGDKYVYDINTNTNYNPEAQKKTGMDGCKKLAEYFKLHKLQS